MWNGLFMSAIVTTTQSVEFLPVFNSACDARACMVLHIDESLMTSEMRDVMFSSFR